MRIIEEYRPVPGVTRERLERLCTSEQDIIESLRKLDGKSFSFWSLRSDEFETNEDEEGPYLSVAGGGPDPCYICYLTDYDGSMLNLVNSSQTTPCSIVTGGQLGKYDAKECCTYAQVEQAAIYFYHTSEPCPNLEWADPDLNEYTYQRPTPEQKAQLSRVDRTLREIIAAYFDPEHAAVFLEPNSHYSITMLSRAIEVRKDRMPSDVYKQLHEAVDHMVHEKWSSKALDILVPLHARVVSKSQEGS